MSGMNPPPKVFISYSWDGEEHRSWVRDLAVNLIREGIHVILDQWHVVPGESLPRFMETAIRENDFVLIICTPQYKDKSENKITGSRYEGDIIGAEILNFQNRKKFIPILREGEWKEVAPTSLLGCFYIDLRGATYPRTSYNDLLATIHGTWPEPPSVGIDRSERAAGDASHEMRQPYDVPGATRGAAISYEERGRIEMSTAPALFLEAFKTLGGLSMERTMEAFESVARILKVSHPMWAGTAYCCYAYCLKQMKKYQDAFLVAEEGRRIGLNLIGHWYYYDVVTHALNHLDQLPAALRMIEEAIWYYGDQAAPGNKADHLFRKANVLKQQAFPLSTNPGTYYKARPIIFEALRAISESLAITKIGWEEEVSVELDGIVRVARRVGVQLDDLHFLETMPNIEPIIRRFFST